MASGPNVFPDQFVPASIGGRPFRLVYVEGVDGSPLELAVPAQSNAEPLLEALQVVEDLESAGQTVDQLRRVGMALPAAGLPAAFNYMYWHLSRGVDRSIQRSRRKLISGYPSFQMPDKVDKTVPIFAEEYLGQSRILAEGLVGDDAALLAALDKMNLPWLLTNLHPLVHRPNTDGVQAMAGMTSHIDLDLQEALRKSGTDPNYYEDYTTIMNILFRMTKQDLAPVLVPGKFPNSLKRIFAMPALAHIAVRREVAWGRSFELAEAASPAKDEVLPDGTMPERYHHLRLEHEDDTARRIGRLYVVGSAVTRMFSGTDQKVDSIGAKLYQQAA